MEKHFYKKIYIIALCNFWHRSLSWPNTQHIQKLATEDIWFLRYCRSRFFTFVCFMRKLTVISLGQNNKSCRIIHHEANKIGFTFFWFFCDFLRNLQESANPKYYLSCDFADRPLILFDSYAEALTSQLPPGKKPNLAMSPLWRWPTRLEQNSGDAPPEPGLGG
jgi:hypothetical protein